jgi:DNA (cytosine-5)-methyltransferase 1
MDIGITSAGFRHEFFAEIDEYCRAVLHHRWPGVTVYDDVRAVAGAGDPGGLPDRGSLDLLAGGFPCQDLSVAGKRKGLAGERSGLFHEFMRVTDALRPSAVLLENVEGLFSSNGGRDFAVVLEALAERGYEWTYRLLDSQHFGVPQRRRRVFVLAIAGEHSAARRIGEVLALTESSSGHLAEGGPSWPFAAARSGQGTEGSGSEGRVVGTLAAKDGPHSGQAYILVTTADIAGTLMAAQGRGWRMDAESAASGHLVVQTFQQKASGAYDEEEIASTQVARQAKSATDLIAFRKSARVSGPDSPETWVDDGIANTLNTFDVGDVRTTHAVVGAITKSNANDPGWHENYTGMVVEQPRVRRLTPLECERLQGYPDGWTNIPWRKKDHAPDSRRYAACGNGVTSTVAFWIAARLAVVLNGE